MKKEVIYLMVRVEVETNFENISDTVHEVESKAVLNITDTPEIKILDTEILLTRIRNTKK